MDVAFLPYLAFGVCCPGAFILVLVLIIRAGKAEKARRERIAQWAAHNGWTVVDQPRLDWATHLPRGDSHRFTFMVGGTFAGVRVAVAEYTYVEEGMRGSDGRRSSWTRYLVVTGAQLPHAYPRIAVQRRVAMLGLRKWLGKGTFAATGDPAFDAMFEVWTDDPSLVGTLLGPLLMAELLAGRLPTWTISGTDLLVWRQGAIKEPEEIRRDAEAAVRIMHFLGR